MTLQANSETSLANHKKTEGVFYLGWIVLTCLCVPVAFVFSMIVLKIIVSMVGDFIYVNGVRHITEDYLLMYVFVPLVSLLTGVVQYWLLRHYLAGMGWWVLATIAGWFLGVLLIELPSELGWIDAPLTNLDLIFLLMGLAIGIAQWSLLRRRLVRAGWWIVANVVGWGLLGLITPGNTLDQSGLLTLGLLPACATAAMLALYRNRVSRMERLP